MTKSSDSYKQASSEGGERGWGKKKQRWEEEESSSIEQEE
jgi:hypothetical protein